MKCTYLGAGATAVTIASVLGRKQMLLLDLNVEGGN
jgi:hypothetical protein